MTYKLELSYKGTFYQGWQIQPHTDMTVQGQLNKALRVISQSQGIHSLAAGRTDAGVHALKQVVRIKIPLDINAKNLIAAVNANLPKDIRVLSAEKVAASFHPLAENTKKEYRYAFSLENMNPHFNDQISFIKGGLDIDVMKKGMALFVGKKPFFNYYCKGTPVKTTVREIFEASLEEKKSFFPQELIFFEAKVVGDGFLKHMVRLIMGALFQLARGKIHLQQIEMSFQKKLPSPLGPVVESKGLYLFSLTKLSCRENNNTKKEVSRKL